MFAALERAQFIMQFGPLAACDPHRARQPARIAGIRMMIVEQQPARQRTAVRYAQGDALPHADRQRAGRATLRGERGREGDDCGVHEGCHTR